MALLDCKECNASVSQFASACPKCGCPVAVENSIKQSSSKEKSLLSSLGMFVEVSVLLIVGIMLLGWFFSPKDQPQVSSITSGQEQSPSNDELLNRRIDREAALCQSGHMEACDAEKSLAYLKQTAGK